MEREELKRLIVGLIPEKDLREYIEAHDYPFSDRELVMMAYDLSPDCVKRTELLTKCASVLSNAARQFALRILDELEKTKARFHENSDCVYELKIKDTPNAYEERYLCGSYQAAIDMIKWFCEEYDVTLTECSDISVCKRRIIREADGHGEDYVAEVQLDCDLNEVRYYSNELYNNWYPDDCKKNCTDCNVYSLCNDVQYPCILNDRDIVKFRNGFDVEYGVALYCSESEAVDNHYIIKLSEKLTPISADAVFGAHMHIPPYNVSKISMEQLPEKFRDICARLISYLKETGNL